MALDPLGATSRQTHQVGRVLAQSLVTPFFHLWYVVSLVVWRVVAPSWMRLRYPLLTAMFLGAATKFTMIHIGNGESVWPHITGTERAYTWLTLLCFDALLPGG